MSKSEHVSAAEALRFLQRASNPNVQFYVEDQKPDLNYRGVVRFVMDGWVLQAYWSNGFFNYVDSLTSPWGSIGNSKQWHNDDGAPDHVEDLLTEEEFGWLCWSLMAADLVENQGSPERRSSARYSSEKRSSPETFTNSKGRDKAGVTRGMHHHV
jgi:hypothetical protein